MLSGHVSALTSNSSIIARSLSFSFLYKPLLSCPSFEEASQVSLSYFAKPLWHYFSFNKRIPFFFNHIGKIIHSTTKVILRSMKVCVISEHRQGILNTVEIDILGHAHLNHRWCMRHFCLNFYRVRGSKELSDDLQDCCLAYSEHHFLILL
jgi:hypothetical protein